MGVEVSVATMTAPSRVGANKGLQAEAINTNTAITKSFLWIIALPFLNLLSRTSESSF
jgi:hypothetical protein